MRLGKLRWKNMLSYGKKWTELDLGSNLLVNIVGTNGDGKSVFLDVLHYAFTGKPFRKITLAALVNNINNKGALVELEADRGDKHVLVRRGMKPNVFEVEVNGEPLDKDAKSADLQSRLESILGFNSKTLRFVMIMSSMNYKPFLRLDAADKRLFVDDVLNVGVFTQLSVFVRQKFGVLKASITDAENAIKMLESNLAIIREMNAKVVNNADDQIAMLKEKADSLRRSVLLLEEQNKGTSSELAAIKAALEEIEGKRDDELSAITSSADETLASMKTEIDRDKEKIQSAGNDEIKALGEHHGAKIKELEVKATNMAQKIGSMKAELSKLDSKGQGIVKQMAVDEAAIDADQRTNDRKRRFLTENAQCPNCEQRIADEFKEESFAELDSQDAELERRRKEVKKAEGDVDAVTDEMDGLKRAIYEREQKAAEFGAKLTEFKLACQKAVNAKQAEVGKLISDRHQAALERINKVRSEAKDKADAVKDKYSAETTELKQRGSSLSAEGKARKQSIEDKLSTVRDYMAQIERLENPEVKEAKDETGVLDELNEARKSLDALADKKRIFEIAVKLLSDKGFKTFVIKKYIPVLNKYVNDYLELLEAHYRLKFDEDWNEQILARGYEKLSYESFSSGEKARCDLALLFGFLELAKVKSSVDTNFLALDEVADNSLDKSGVYGIISIINKLKAKGYTVFVISHRDEIRDEFDRTLEATKAVFSELTEAR